MTISSTTLRKTATGDGSTTAVTFPYRFLADADLKVYLDGTLKTLTTHYTLTGAGDAGGGTVTFLTAPALDVEIVILNDPANTQTLDLVDNDIFPAESMERTLDRITLQIQRCRDLIARSVTLSDTDVASVTTTLPSPTATYYLRWNSAGTALENVASLSTVTVAVSSFTESLLDETSASAWRSGLSVYSIAQVDAAILAAVTPYLEYRDEKADTTPGGAATPGSWFTRTLNTESADSSTLGSLSGNAVTLPAGTYECEVIVPAYKVGRHQARLYNVTGTAVLLYGTSEEAGTGAAGTTSSSTVTGRFTLASSSAVRVEHRVETNTAGTDLGTPTSFGNTEVYTIARFWKVA